MRRPRFSAVSSALLALAILAPLAARDARAGWPPPESATAADMADPANWPNDPGYAFSADGDGAWNFYSFMPDVATSVRSQETASGMSIDLAWRYTIGDPQIRIVVTDSGIKWDEDDIIEKASLSAGELVNH